jgi:hypothetical protein
LVETAGSTARLCAVPEHGALPMRSHRSCPRHWALGEDYTDKEGAAEAEDDDTCARLIPAMYAAIEGPT